MHPKDSILYVLTKSQAFLKDNGIESSRLDAELLLSEVLNFNRVKLYTHFEYKLTEEQKDNYRKLLKERAKKVPIAYLTKKKNFYNSTFYVDPSVLIPRPETEELVEWVLKDTPSIEEYTVLDLCTGSGCLGISLKRERPNWILHFSDLSMEALEVCKKNYFSIIEDDSFNNFYISDLFDSIPIKKFNLITINPPYIPSTEKELLSAGVYEYEPHLALFLDHHEEFLTKLIKNLDNYIEDTGNLFMEIHPDWEPILKKIVLQSNKHIVFKKDYSNKIRMAKISNELTQ